MPFSYILLIWREVQSKFSEILVVGGQTQSLTTEPDPAGGRRCRARGALPKPRVTPGPNGGRLGPRFRIKIAARAPR